MTRTDRAVVGLLVVAFAVVAIALGTSGSPPSPVAARPSASPVAVAAGTRPYREGVVGRPSSISPLTARTRADRDLVGLIFSGLVALGPNDTIVPDLASSWSTDKKGKIWTFHLRDAVWQDGAPVTAADVVFTIHVLQDPTYAGPAAGSWKDVTAVAVDEHTVTFELATPLGGFLQAATQPIVPAHLLEDVPISTLADNEFGHAPVGTGPYRLVSLDDTSAVLAPTETAVAAPGASPNAPAANQSPDVAGVSPLSGIELQFFDDPVALAHAYEAGQLDAATGLDAADAMRLGGQAGNRLLRYPTTTLTALFFNLRASHKTFTDARVRKALLQAIDRPALIQADFGGAATTADSLVPPTSWAFDPTVSQPLAFNRQAAARALRAAGWKSSGGKWTAPGGGKPVTLELLGPDGDTNAETAGAVTSIAADLQRLGLRVTPVGLTPNELVVDRIETGNFEAVVVDINIGLDPDLYPLLASTQTRSGGLNIGGIQNQALDKQLGAARAPGSLDKRKAAYRVLQQTLAGGEFVLPICFRDELVVVRDTLSGPVVRPIADASGRFWDVLTWRLAIGR